MLGGWRVPELVAAGDYLVRRFTPGVGRKSSGGRPLATVDELREAVSFGRWRGMGRLREAVTLIREDSWSPMESQMRVAIVQSGLPEPALNRDVFTASGKFLGCVDMVYSRFLVGIEYQGRIHHDQYAEDIERVEALRANGWYIIQVSSALASKPSVLCNRIEAALRERGWMPDSTSRPKRAAHRSD